VLEDGDLRGSPVFVLHGTPGARLLYHKHVEDARRRGIRLIGHDRAGYGGSTPKPGRTVANDAFDVAAIADDLGLDRFAVWGHSGGGPHALACAALLPQRVVAVSSLASPAPYPAEGIDYLAGMGEANAEDLRLLLSNQPAWEAKLAAEAPMMASATIEQTVEFIRSLLSDVDRAALTDDVAELLVSQAREGMRLGFEGLKDDNISGVKPWGFELSAIHVPLQLWHGEHDKFVPFSHGEWLARRLPKSDIHLEPTDGHVTLFSQRIPLVHEWLLSHF